MRTDRILSAQRLAIYRHPLLVRITHWINALCLALLLMSGLQILMAHPALYWGEVSRFDQPLIQFGDSFFATWLLLPSWADLGAGRRWHFFCAWLLVINGLLYVLYSLLSGRLRQTLMPTPAQWTGLGESIRDHLRLRFSHATRQYNLLQKLSYLGIMFGVLPLMVMTGLAMSPGLDAQFSLSYLMGGRQSARTLHFFGAATLLLFFVVHILMVIVAGPLNEMRSMLTGWFVIDPKAKP